LISLRPVKPLSIGIVSPFSSTELALALAMTGLRVTGESSLTTEDELLSISLPTLNYFDEVSCLDVGTITRELFLIIEEMLF